MILEIRLSNFFSIKDEVVLDMQTASIQTKKASEATARAKALRSYVNPSTTIHKMIELRESL